jgi:glycosyltransferase involved in cell wall biosynthesis
VADAPLAGAPDAVVASPGPAVRQLVLVWGPPSHGPRSRVLARELGLPIRFMDVTARRGLLVAPYKYLAQTVATLRCLARERPRGILVQSPPSFAVLAVYLWSSRTGARYVVDAHSDAMDTPYWTRPRWLHRHLARRAAATVVTNEHYAQRLRSWGANALVIRDVPTTFEVGEPWPDVGAFRIAVVNTFAADEPLSEVLEAARSLPDVEFRVTGSLRRAPDGLVVSAPPNVTFTGFLPDDRYYGLLSSSHAVMCLTTRDHTMQRGACEALSLGTPIITSRWPLLEEYFDRGAVHVVNDGAGIRAGIDEMRRRHAHYQQQVRELRSARRAEWREASDALRALLEGTERRSVDLVVHDAGADPGGEVDGRATDP